MVHVFRQVKQRNPASRLKLLIFLSLVFIFIFSMIPVLKSNTAKAATMKPLNMCYYGSHTTAIDQRIVNAKPMFLLDNTPNGPWHGNCNASLFAAAGIKVFSYIDGGYEATQSRAIPNSLQANLSYIDAIANEAGVYGIFLDEVSSYPSSAGLSYLSQIYSRAKSHGLAVMFNTGVDSWSDTLMQYCDYMNSSEVFSGASMTASQQKWASRTVLLSQGIGDGNTAANLTNTAVSRGFLAHYACVSYGSLPSYLETYVSQVSGGSSSTPTPTPSNLPPVLSPIGNKTAIVGTKLSFTVSATDPNGNSLTYSASGLPSGASFNSSTRTFSWTPSSVTTANVTFTVSDGSLTDSESITLTAYTQGTQPTPSSYNTTCSVTSVPSSSGGQNEYNLYVKIISTSVSGLNVGDNVWVAATTSDYPDLFTLGEVLNGDLSHSLGWWTLKATGGSTPPDQNSTPAPTPSPVVVSGNTSGTVASRGVATGATNEYSLYVTITSTTVNGLAAGQKVWCAATTTNFPNLLTVGSTVTGNLDHSLGWWVLKK